MALAVAVAEGPAMGPVVAVAMGPVVAVRPAGTRQRTRGQAGC